MQRVFKILAWAAAGLLALILALGIVFWTPDIERAELIERYGGAPSEFLHLDSGTVLHYRDQGPKDAPPVVLLHGTAASLHTWEPWVARLTPAYRVITLDLPGHGLTGATAEGRYDRAGMVSAVDALATDLGLQRFVIGGNSMGGEVSLAYALAHPERALGLILVASAGAPLADAPARSAPLGFRIGNMPLLRQLMTKITPRSMVAEGLASVLVDESVATEEMIDRYWELLRMEGSREAMIQRFAQAEHGSLPVEAISVPALVQWGEMDMLIPLDVGEALVERMPDAELVVYRSAGHIPMEERPAETAADARAFLDKIYGRG